MNVREKREDGMAIGRRISVLAGVMASAIALMLSASPASAQVGGPGAQATPVVGVSGTAACPTNVGADRVAYAGPAGALTIVSSDGACTSFSANSQGTFTVGASGFGTFGSSCTATPLTSSSTVTVPVGTRVNGGPPVEAPTVVTTANTPVVFPGGVAATLNVQTLTATTVTQTAIVVGGVQIGRVVCGAANVYPLAVDAASASGAAPAVASHSAASSGGGQSSTTILLLVAAAGVVVLAQGAMVRSRRRGQGGATG